jgi:hypothetical protein
MWVLVGTGCSGGKFPDTEATGVDSGNQWPGLSGDGGQVEAGGLVVCHDPGAREESPMDLLAGGDWDSQAVDSAADPLGNLGWGAAVADLNGDDRLDIFLPNAGPSELYLGTDEGLFVRAPEGSIPEEVQGRFGIGAIAVDADDDGDLDLLQMDAGADALLLNDGEGRFLLWTHTLVASGEDDVSYAAAFGDWDRDGDLDLVSAVMKSGMPEQPGGAWDPGQPSHLLRNDGGAFFSDQDSLLPADSNHGYPFAIAWVDLDDDGDLDIHVGNDHGLEVLPNRFWRNDGGSFADVSEQTGIGVALDTMGMGFGDLNSDGRPDLLMSGTRELVLLESQPDGTWVRTDAARGLTLRGMSEIGWGVDLADMDNSGTLDALANFGYWPPVGDNAAAQADALYLLQDGRYDEEVAAAWGLADVGLGRGFVLADLNGDGWLDVVKRQGGQAAQVHLSRCGTASWLKVRLSQPGRRNAFSIGAAVEVETGETVHKRWVMAGGTSLSSGGPPELHFGLGEEEEVHAIRVRWPDGTGSEWTGGLEARRTLTVVRDGE